VTDPDLVAHWPFDETAGATAFDQTPNNKNGSLIGFPTDPWTAGQQGGALTFDGVDDHIEIDGYQGIAGQQSRTTAVWIKTTDSVGSIITWGLPDYGQMWMMMISSNGRLKLGVWGGYIVGTTLIRDGRWHHIAAVLENDGSPDVSEVKLYVDGQPDTISAVSPRSIDTGTQLEVQIGRMDQNHPDYYLVGSLDDVHIYQRHLSDEEIGHLAQ